MAAVGGLTAGLYVRWMAYPTVPPTRRRYHRLPLSLDAAEGESLFGFTSRLAAYWEQPLSTVFVASGLAPNESYRARPQGFGVFLSRTEVETFALTTALAPQDVRSMLLSRYDGIAFSASQLTGGVGGRVRRLGCSEWVFITSSHYCPTCLYDTASIGSPWRIEWKLPWSFCMYAPSSAARGHVPCLR